MLKVKTMVLIHKLPKGLKSDFLAENWPSFCHSLISEFFLYFVFCSNSSFSISSLSCCYPTIIWFSEDSPCLCLGDTPYVTLCVFWVATFSFSSLLTWWHKLVRFISKGWLQGGWEGSKIEKNLIYVIFEWSRM